MPKLTDTLPWECYITVRREDLAVVDMTFIPSASEDYRETAYVKTDFADTRARLYSDSAEKLVTHRYERKSEYLSWDKKERWLYSIGAWETMPFPSGSALLLADAKGVIKSIDANRHFGEVKDYTVIVLEGKEEIRLKAPTSTVEEYEKLKKNLQPKKKGKGAEDASDET